MKYLVFFALFFLVNNVTAQVLEIPKNDKVNIIKAQPLVKILPQAKLLYNTETGKVYALPQDKMPCLVPQTNSNMPIAKLDMNEFKKIPNALPEQKIIPGKEILDLQKNNK